MSGLMHEAGGRLQVGVDDRPGRRRARRGSAPSALRRHHHVAAEQQVGAAGGDADAWRCLPARGAMRTWLITAPFFCASPVKSSAEQPLPSRCAAMPSSAPMVMTPVPPMPVTRMLYGASQFGAAAAAAGRRTGSPESTAALARLRSVPPWTVTKLGQKPLTQEKSLLQCDWSICALAAELGLERLHRHAVGGLPSSRRSLRRQRR